jgi:hypothetical protein
LAISCTLDHDRKLVLVSAEGEMTLPDLEVVFNKVVIEGGMSYRKLVDTSRATSRLTEDEVLTLGARISAYRAFEPRGPVAIVTGPDSHENARRFLNLAGAERPARIFTAQRKKQAFTWLMNQPIARIAHPGPGSS